MTEDELANNIADYLATRNTPWSNESKMREIVEITVRLVFNEVLPEARKLLDRY
jgi:hypothetical protein